METVTKKQLLEMFHISYPTLRKLLSSVPGLDYKKKRIFTKTEFKKIKNKHG